MYFLMYTVCRALGKEVSPLPKAHPAWGHSLAIIPLRVLHEKTIPVSLPRRRQGAFLTEPLTPVVALQ